MTPPFLSKPPAIEEVRVLAPSRLHFGMFSFGHHESRAFGGIGAMIELPGLEVVLRCRRDFRVRGEDEERIRRAAIAAWDTWGDGRPAAFEVEVVRAPPFHSGLGTGTQLGMSVVAAVGAFAGQASLSGRAMAQITGRGCRSAIGVWGFCRGGLLLDPGKSSDGPLPEPVVRCELPADWRFVLVLNRRRLGLSGEDERRAFAELPPIPRSTTASLCREALLQLIPAQAGDFEAFSESLYGFGFEAGMAFAPRQGGPFADGETHAIVDLLRNLGVRGVGQSSWGPTVFAVTASESDARRLVSQLAEQSLCAGCELVVSRPAKRGAAITVQTDGGPRTVAVEP
jgi:beta-RFAP synthase